MHNIRKIIEEGVHKESILYKYINTRKIFFALDQAHDMENAICNKYIFMLTARIMFEIPNLECWFVFKTELLYMNIWKAS